MNMVRQCGFFFFRPVTFEATVAFSLWYITEGRLMGVTSGGWETTCGLPIMPFVQLF